MATETKFELLSSPEQENLLSEHGFLLSRREANGFVISLYMLENKYIEVYFYMRSHEVVRIEMINEDKVLPYYQDRVNFLQNKVA